MRGCGTSRRTPTPTRARSDRKTNVDKNSLIIPFSHLPNARLAIDALIMITIEGARRPGLNAAHKNLVKQLPLIAAEFPEIADCHYGTINVQLHVSLLVVAPDHRSQPIHWDDADFPSGEIFDLLRIQFAAPVDAAPVALHSARIAGHGDTQIHEVLARRLDIPAEAQCRVTINRNAVQLAYRHFPPMVIVV